MICAKCKKECDRRSNAQKYCEHCSPDKYRFKKSYKPVKEPVKKEMPRLICRDCGKFIKYAHSRRIKKLDRDRCHKCEIKFQNEYQRRRKKELWLFGKFLIEQWDIMKKKYPDNHTEYDQGWTPSRYVSQEEIDEMKRRSFAMRSYFSSFTKWQDISIIETRESWDRRENGRIYCPGYYRVEKIPDDKRQFWFRSETLSMYKRNFHYDLFIEDRYERNRNARLMREDQLRRKKILERERQYFLLGSTSLSVQQFASAIMMAGELKQKIAG